MTVDADFTFRNGGLACLRSVFLIRKTLKRVMYHNVHCSSIYNTRTWNQPKCPSTDEWIKKRWHNGILLSHKKKRNWVICSEVDGPRLCRTDWSKSERKKQIPYANTYIWNLETKNGSEEPRGRTGIKMQTEGMDLRTWGGGSVSWDEVREWHGHIYTTKCKTDS